MAQRTISWLEKWAPKDKEYTLTLQNLRWNIARANSAEAELRVIKEELSTVKRLLNRGYL